MQTQDALADLDIAFRQLEFTIKLLSFCELGHINPADFDTDHVVELGNEQLNFPSGHFSDKSSLEKAAGTGVLIAMSATALALNDVFDAFEIKANPDASDNAGQLRALIYMIRCAYAHGIAAPLWKVHAKYQRAFVIDFNSVRLTVDLRPLNGQPFNIEQIGGYANWYRMRDEALRLLT